MMKFLFYFACSAFSAILPRAYFHKAPFSGLNLFELCEEIFMDKPKFNRWLVVLGAILIQLCLGAIYAWSVYTAELVQPTEAQYQVAVDYVNSHTGPVEEMSIEEKAELDQAEAVVKSVEKEDGTKKFGIYGFSKAGSQSPFSMGLATFGFVMILAGNWQKKVGPRIVALTGGILLGLAYILAGLLGSSLSNQFIFIGLIGGAGIGLAYVCPIAVGVKWFPDMKGVITGLAVAGFGFGALIWVKLAGQWGHLIESMGVQQTWLVFGIVYFLVISIGSIWMVNPPDGYAPAGWKPPAPSDAAMTGAVEFDQWKMLRTPQFYMIWFCFIAGAMAGLMVIGIIKLFGIDALQQSGISADQAGVIAGTAMAVYLSLANGIGRIAWGTISDKIGRKMSIFLMCLFQGIAMLAFFYVGKYEIGLYVLAAVIGFNFGGNFALYPAATADYFGNKNVGVNYGWMFSAYAIGGSVGPMIAGKFRDMASGGAGYDAWLIPFVIAGVASLIAAFVILATKQPKAD